MHIKSLPSFSPVIHHANLISQKFIALVKNSAEQEDEFLLEQSLADFLGTLIESTCKKTIIDNPENIYREKISKAKKFIEDNYIDDFSLAELSSYTGLSPYHLLRSFKTVIGLTPNKFPGGGHYSAIATKQDGSFQLVWSDSRTGVFQLQTCNVKIR